MKKLIWLIILLPLQLIAQYNWLDLPNAPKSWRCDDTYFLNDQMGWVIHAYYGYLSPNQYGQIYKTTDGGNIWQLMKDSSKTFYRCVGFADSLTGWVGNVADTNLSNGILLTRDTVPLYQTNDGGKTWAPVILPQPHLAGVCGITVVNDSVVYAYGRWSGPGGYIKTMNKGKIWIYHDMSAYCFGMVDGWFFNKDTGFITTASPGYKAEILSTVDGGNTWQVCYRSTRADTDEVWKIFFPSRDTGYASIEYQALVTPTTKRYFVKTTDGGKTWNEMPFISSYDEEGIGFINDTTGWIGGDGCMPTYITSDGGKTWQPDNGFGVATPPYQFCSHGYAINRFRKINDTLMYACGITSYKLNGNITGLNELNRAKYKMFNYPNPYSNQTTIEYSLAQTCSNVKLEIFDARGLMIFSKDFGAQIPGEYKYVFEQGIPSGAYYYTIIAGSTTIVNKMIKIK